MGYITGKGASKLAKVKVNLPLLLAASVLPDVDLLMRFLMHRGPTHSLITITVLMIPFFIVYRKQVIPYYAALLSHILIGDFFTGGVQLFWPLSQGWFGALNINVTSLTNVIAELVLFFLTLPIMYKLGDLQTLLKPHNKNWVLIIPLGAVLGPLLAVGRDPEFTLPTLLAVPSLFYIGLFAYSMFVELRAEHNQDADKLQPSKFLNVHSPVLHVERGIVIHATRDLKALSFKEILEQHLVEDLDRAVQPDVQVGGWNKFVKTKITGSRPQRNKRTLPDIPKKRAVQQPKKGGRSWLHAT